MKLSLPAGLTGSQMETCSYNNFMIEPVEAVGAKQQALSFNDAAKY